jgi:hypothetical protein
MRYEFRSVDRAVGDYDEIVGELADPFRVFKATSNLEHDENGLHLYCRGGAGAGFMVVAPHDYGSWAVRMRISAGLETPTTKVCLLLWQDGGGWPPEIDFNESGDRARSSQTEHYGVHVDGHHPEIHTSYPIEQTEWHTFGVEITPELVTYLCNGRARAAVPNEVPGTLWNLHVRTEPNLDTESETRLDVRWIEIPD